MAAQDILLLEQSGSAAGDSSAEQEEETENLFLCLTEHASTDTSIEGSFGPMSGFLCPSDLAESLPGEFVLWELTVRALPYLLRNGTAHHAVATLPALHKEINTLSDCMLPRAAIVISSLLHSYAFECRNMEINRNPNWKKNREADFTCACQEKPIQTADILLPESLMQSWDTICSRMARPFGGIRMIADDLLNNVRAKGMSRGLALEYFDIAEERTSGGLQVEMEHAFAPALEPMTRIRILMEIEDDEGIIRALYAITETLINCAGLLVSPPCQDRPDGFDPTVWAKTYPAIGAELRDQSMTNSGVNAPLFHALDSFIGTVESTGELNLQQLNRRRLLPPQVREFILAIGDPEHSIRNYISRREGSVVAASFDALLQVYAWLLERHRMRAIGLITISSASGRKSTAGGAQQDNTLSLDELLHNQMMRGIEGRLGDRPRKLLATIESVELTGRKTNVVTLRLQCPVPVQPADRIQIWPDGAEPTNDKRVVPLRHYSVTDVSSADHEGLSQRIRLTVALSGGAGPEFLQSIPPGRQLAIKAVLAPESWSPKDETVPLLLVAQGAGVGPFLGFLGQRRALINKQRRVANVTLIVAARVDDDIPHCKELISFTQEIPSLTVHFALSRTPGRRIQDGKTYPYSAPKKVTEVLSTLDEATKTEIYGQRGHIYVCGSVSFGKTVRTALHEQQILDLSRYHEDCFGGPNAPSAPKKAIELCELVRHNKPDDLWMAIDGVVYDLSTFTETHPGGLKTLIESAGSVADRRFLQIHGGDMNQGVLAHMGQYAIGSLQYDDNLSADRIAVLEKLVAFQNILTNNTRPLQGRTMPFYVICDSLLITTTNLKDLTETIDKEDIMTLAHFAALEDVFGRLKTACWSFLGKASPVELESAESMVRATYRTHWEEMQVLFACAKEFCFDNKQDDRAFAKEFQDFMQRSILQIGEPVFDEIDAYKG